MRHIVPPLCLVLSLLLFIAAFAVMSLDSPQPGIEWHRARLGDDEQYRDLLEERWERRRLKHWLLIGSLFGTAVIAACLAYMSMRPSSAR
jgi:hypothetical protein